MVTDFSTNRKLIYDFLKFLLVINTNLPPILHHFQVMVRFSLARGECLTLMLSLGAIPCNIAISDIPLKTTFFGLHFCRGKYRCIFNHLHNPPQNLPNLVNAAVRAITPLKVTQGHRFWYQSKAHMRLPISN